MYLKSESYACLVDYYITKISCQNCTFTHTCKYKRHYVIYISNLE